MDGLEIGEVVRQLERERRQWKARALGRLRVALGIMTLVVAGTSVLGLIVGVAFITAGAHGLREAGAS